MNIQTEHLDDHTARFTVEIDAERFEKSKRQAARKIANQVRIPGFRKGKAPYNILVQKGFEQQIVMDAVEDLSQTVYRETIEQSDVEPYGPGAFEDFKLDPTITFIYTVPLRPTIELGDYQSVRLDYEAPEITDEQVDDAMKRLQEQEALTEESQQPVAVGNRVTMDVHSEFVDDPAPAETEVTEDAGDDEADEDGEAPERDAPAAGDQFIHEHDLTLRVVEDQELLPGFNDELIGANKDDELEFELTVPEDSEDYPDLVGRKIRFHVSIKNVETVTLPELNDDLAARITADEDEPLTLLQLRVRMRETLENEAERRARGEFSGRVLDEIVGGATIAYPEVMVEESIDSMIRDLDSRLRQQGMTLNDYYNVTGRAEEDLREEYREGAIRSLERSLVLGEIVSDLDLTVPEYKVNNHIDTMLQRFGEQAEGLRSLFDTPNMRSSIVNDLLQEMVTDVLVAIGRGEPLPEPQPEPEPADGEAESAADAGDDLESQTAEATVEDETPVAETEEPVTNPVEAEEADEDEEASDDKAAGS